MVTRTLDILYEDNHLLAINKPACLATMGVPSGEDSLLESCESMSSGSIENQATFIWVW